MNWNYAVALILDNNNILSCVKDNVMFTHQDVDDFDYSGNDLILKSNGKIIRIRGCFNTEKFDDIELLVDFSDEANEVFLIKDYGLFLYKRGDQYICQLGFESRIITGVHEASSEMTYHRSSEMTDHRSSEMTDHRSSEMTDEADVKSSRVTIFLHPDKTGSMYYIDHTSIAKLPLKNINQFTVVTCKLDKYFMYIDQNNHIKFYDVYDQEIVAELTDREYKHIVANGCCSSNHYVIDQQGLVYKLEYSFDDPFFEPKLKPLLNEEPLFPLNYDRRVFTTKKATSH